MRRLWAASLLTLGLIAATANAAPQPIGGTVTGKATLTGKISALTRTSITIDGRTCRVAAVIPKALGYRIGTQAKMTCVQGVLRTLFATRPVPKLGEVLVVPAQQTAGSPPAATYVIATTSGGTLRLAGTGTISSLASDSVTFSGSLKCSVGAGSPDLGEVAFGDRVSFRCTAELPASFRGDLTAAMLRFRNAGVLGAIARA